MQNTAKTQGGFTIWARQTIDSEIFFWKPDKWFKIWFYIINRVNHKDNKRFKKGSAYIEYKEISLKTKATYNQVDSFIQWAKEQSMITTQKSIRGNTITVLNYAKYQDWDTYKTEALTDNKTEAEPKHNRSITHAINKDDKDVIDEKIDIPCEPAGSPEVTTPLKPFDLPTKLSSMVSSPDTRMWIIQAYWSRTSIAPQNEPQYRTALKRELRAAGELVGFSQDDILGTMDYLASAVDFKWTLETVRKYIDRPETLYDPAVLLRLLGLYFRQFKSDLERLAHRMYKGYSLFELFTDILQIQKVPDWNLPEIAVQLMHDKELYDFLRNNTPKTTTAV